MDSYVSLDSLLSLNYQDHDTEEPMERHPFQTISSTCSTSGREAITERWNTVRKADFPYHRKIVLRRPAHVTPLVVHLDRKLPTSLPPQLLHSWKMMPLHGHRSHRVDRDSEIAADIPNRGKRRKRRYRMTVSRTSSTDLFSHFDTEGSSSSTSVFVETRDPSKMFLHYSSDGWLTVRTAALHQVQQQRSLLSGVLSLDDAPPGDIDLVLSRRSRLDWKPSLDNKLQLDCGTLSGTHLWLEPVASNQHSHSVNVKASRILVRSTALVVDSTLLAGRRHDRGDEMTSFELRQLLETSRKVTPQLLICCSSRTLQSFTDDLWSNKRDSLPEPDMLILAGGTQVAYRTPAGWSMDESWLSLLLRSWDRAAVERAVARAIELVASQSPNQEVQRVRLKLDTWKQQGPLRLRLLVSRDASSVAQVVEKCLREESRALSLKQQLLTRRKILLSSQESSQPFDEPPMSSDEPGVLTSTLKWKLQVQRHVEGGGAAHRGWSAIDIVPHRGGLDQALRHIMSRFQIKQEMMAGILDASSGLGAACSSLTLSASNAPNEPQMFGLGLLMVGASDDRGSGIKRSSRRAFGPRSVLDGLDSLGLLRASDPC